VIFPFPGGNSLCKAHCLPYSFTSQGNKKDIVITTTRINDLLKWMLHKLWQIDNTEKRGGLKLETVRQTLTREKLLSYS